MIIKVKKPRFRSKAAFFDFDWTIVRPQLDRTFPKDVDDWQWLRESVPETIGKYYNKGYGIYIVTNQTKEWKQRQIEQVAHLLDVPLTICIAWKKEERKPSRFLFEEALTADHRDKITTRMMI
jgi:DNA 3'-phosphatase